MKGFTASLNLQFLTILYKTFFSDLTEIAVEDSVPEKMDAAKASNEAKPPMENQNKKSTEKADDGDEEKKECGRRTGKFLL